MVYLGMQASDDSRGLCVGLSTLFPLGNRVAACSHEFCSWLMVGSKWTTLPCFACHNSTPPPTHEPPSVFPFTQTVSHLDWCLQYTVLPVECDFRRVVGLRQASAVKVHAGDECRCDLCLVALCASAQHIIGRTNTSMLPR